MVKLKKGKEKNLMTIIDGKLTLGQWRGLREMTKTELSNKSGVSIETISKFEENPQMMERANYSTLKSLAEALDIKVSNFFE